MAGTVTITYQKIGTPDRPVRKVTLAWVSHTDGSVSGTLTDYLSGTLSRVVFNPGATAPTAAYDVTLLDENGLDILAGQGANLSETNTTATCPGVPLKDGTTTSTTPCVIDDKLELRVANAGDSKNGEVILYLR